MRELSGRVSGSLVVLRTTGLGAGAIAARPAAADGTRLLPALRVRDDVAVALVENGALVEAVIGVPGAVTVIARDPVRGITLVRVPSARAPVLTIREGQQPLTAPGYVAVAEASAAGTSVRPVFVGRSDSVGDPRWDTPLLTMGRGAAADIGAPVFTLDGRLAGLLTSTEGEPALVPAEVVMAAVDQLLRDGPPPIGDIGVVTQAIDPALAAATGVPVGAAVAAVSADGPAAQVFAPGDVITAVNGQVVRTPEALRQRVARTAPGGALTFTFRRDGGFISAAVTVRARPAAVPPAPAVASPSIPAERTLGLTLRAVPERGSEVTRVQPGSIAEAAGLQAGDVVVAFGRTLRTRPGRHYRRIHGAGARPRDVPLGRAQRTASSRGAAAMTPNEDWREVGGPDALDADIPPTPSSDGLPWLRPLRTRAVLGLTPVVAPAVLFVPIGAVLGPSFTNVLNPTALGYLDAVVAVALAVLGVFAGLALDLRGERNRRIFTAASVEAIVTLLAVGGAFLVLLASWSLPLVLPPALVALTLGLCASVSSAGGADDASPTHAIASGIADLDDVLPIVVSGVLVVMLGSMTPVPVWSAVGWLFRTIVLGIAVGTAGWLLFERAHSQAERNVFIAGTVALDRRHVVVPQPVAIACRTDGGTPVGVVAGPGRPRGPQRPAARAASAHRGVAARGGRLVRVLATRPCGSLARWSSSG